MRRFGWKLPVAGVVVLLLVLLGSKLYSLHSSSLAAARQEAKVAVAHAQTLQHVAEEEAAKAALQFARAQAQRPALVAARKAFDAEATKAPHECEPVIQVAREVLTVSDSITASLDSAFEAQKRATAALTTAVDVLLPATQTLIKASGRPSFFIRILPQITVGVGAVAGLDPLNKFQPWARVGPHLRIGWEHTF